MAQQPVSISFQSLEHGLVEKLLASDGHVYIRSVPDDFDHVSFLARFGNLIPQYDGNLIWSIKPDLRFDNVYSSLNTQPLYPHTECYEFPSTPPRYLALWCLTPAEAGGETTLADGYTFIRSLDPALQLAATHRLYDFTSTTGLRESNLGLSARHPIFETRRAGPPILRFSHQCMRSVEVDGAIDRIKRSALDFFEEMHVAVNIEKNGILLWDNYRMLHSRTGFEDRKRHLRRVWLAESAGDAASANLSLAAPLIR
jgi:alpha-ketoglutarate-dependent taurine dioxygenase